MNAGTKVLSVSGLSILGLGAVSTLGYSLFIGAKPTGRERLLESNLEFNTPQFTNHNSLDYGCAKNIFKEDPDFDKDKLYGCGVANMELWDSDKQFNDKTVDYLIFNSEISLRKGDEGWKINTKFDNKSGPSAEYSHFITTYEKDSNKGWGEKETFLIVSETDHDMQETGSEIKFNRQSDNKEHELLVGGKALNIKIPNGSWYQKTGYLRTYMSSATNQAAENRDGLHTAFKDRKSWSGIWVEDSNSSNSWIFKDIEIFIEEKQYSRVFCKNENGKSDDCWQIIGDGQDQTKVYRRGDGSSGNEKVNTWEDVNGAYKTAREKDPNKEVEEKVKSIINEIKGSNGKWIDTKDFCKFGDERNISEDKWKNLKMFCAKKKS